MFRFGNVGIVDWIMGAVVVLLAISVHETAHGLMAYRLGDYTAKSIGRLSLNPLRHLDPVGAVCMLLFGFGWAKPVMVNPYNLKNPKRDMSLVSLAGPLSNFIMAFIATIVLKILLMSGVSPQGYLSNFVVYVIIFNIGLGVFNLIPIPPLDGSKIFLSLLPSRLYYDIMRYERFGWIVLVAALGLGVLNPIMSTLNNIIFKLFGFLVGGI